MAVPVRGHVNSLQICQFESLRATATRLFTYFN